MDAGRGHLMVEPQRVNVRERISPEVRVSGFAHNDQSAVFFTQVTGAVEPHMTVLDFGAGRGVTAGWPGRFRRELMCLKGKCRRLVGFDLDPAVRENPQIDEAVVGTAGEKLPFADAEFDLIVSRMTFEHVTDPAGCAAELGRILKPGGWLCALTPNRWGMIALGSWLVPERLHGAVLSRLQPRRQERDIFPTCYRMNTLASLERLFPAPHFRHASYTFSGPPTYHGNRMWLARCLQAYEALMPPFGRQMLHVFIQKVD